MPIYQNYKKKYFLNNNYNSKNLKPMEKSKIVCGKKYGLPFEYLMTDIYSGCLNLESVCYGNCTAAQFWLKKGYDFGKRVLNDFDSCLFESSIKDLPSKQKWIRQGWVSDCSFSNESWELTAHISDILLKYDISLLIITKIHKMPSKKTMEKLAKNKTEIRVSLSALDTKVQLEKRLKFLTEYKNMGGISIPYLMSSKYKNNILKDNQEYIINYIVENNFIAGEHPLRIEKDNPLFSELENDGFYHPLYKNQYWFGRILNRIENFVLPPPTHLREDYSLKFNNLTDFQNYFDKTIIKNNLPTYYELKENKYTKEMFDHAAYNTKKYK